MNVRIATTALILGAMEIYCCDVAIGAGLQCVTVTTIGPTREVKVGNDADFTVDPPTPDNGPKWILTGGGCSFAEADWQNSDLPMLLASNPHVVEKKDMNVWHCWAKRPRPFTLTGRARYCRVK